MIKIIYKPMSSLLVRHFFYNKLYLSKTIARTKNHVIIVGLHGTKWKVSLLEVRHVTFTAVMPRGGLATAVDIGLHCFEL